MIEVIYCRPKSRLDRDSSDPTRRVAIALTQHNLGRTARIGTTSDDTVIHVLRLIREGVLAPEDVVFAVQVDGDRRVVQVDEQGQFDNPIGGFSAEAVFTNAIEALSGSTRWHVSSDTAGGMPAFRFSKAGFVLEDEVLVSLVLTGKFPNRKIEIHVERDPLDVHHGTVIIIS
jgi:hypothetical protein